MEQIIQTYQLHGGIEVIADSTALTNKLASTPSLYHEHMFIDAVNDRLYVYLNHPTTTSSSGWKYASLV